MRVRGLLGGEADELVAIHVQRHTARMADGAGQSNLASSRLLCCTGDRGAGSGALGGGVEEGPRR